MIKKELLKKLEGVVSEADLKALESNINKTIKESVALQVEEILDDMDKKADEFCEKQISEGIAAEKAKLIESYDKKLADLEKNMVEKLDQFLENEINEQISDEAITKLAINETYKPIVDGIMSLFEEKFVALDTEGHKVLSEKEEKIQELKDEVSKLVTDKMELSELAESAAVKLKISEKTSELTESQKNRVQAFLEDKSFDEVEKKIDSFIEMITESDNSEDEDESNDNTSLNEEKNFSNEDGSEEEKDEKESKLNESKDDDKEVYSETIHRAENLL